MNGFSIKYGFKITYLLGVTGLLENIFTKIFLIHEGI